MRLLMVIPALGLLASCRQAPKPASLESLRQEFVYSTLAFSPTLSTQAGYHTHRGQTQHARLDDYSVASLAAQRAFYEAFRKKLEATPSESLDPQDQADWSILRDQSELMLLELETIQNYRHNPTVYVELLGSALFNCYVLEYAPKEQRYDHIIARLNAVPVLMQQAKANLRDAPEVWNRVAREENEGNINLIEGLLRKEVPETLRSRYQEAAAVAVRVLRDFNGWLEKDLSMRTSDWRLGREKYARKFALVLGTDRTPEQILGAAEQHLQDVRRQMLRLAGGGRETTDPADLNRQVRRELDRIARRHGTRESYFADANRDLEEARRFVVEKQLLALPPRDNLKVIETPEFMRGIYSVGGFNPAPPLEPRLGAFYWLTPIPAHWSRERIESKLREYNFFGLKLLTIHEAMPGHYVQLEYANDVQPLSRRLLRALFGSGSYVEGWAVYATEVMLDEGYLNGDPGLRLTFLKQQLRMIANAILDIRMQTGNLSDAAAMDLMIRDTFQEREEATAKLQRAKLSSCQLPTYYVGWRDWWRLRRLYQQSQGAQFRLSDFHETALKASAVPIPVLARLLTGRRLEN